jgi:3-deoxy-D-manno-octulosonic-acid transferase
VNLLSPLIAELWRRNSDLEFVISTTSTTGHAVAKSKYPEHTVCYCPLDFSWAVKTALRRIRPSLLVLAELELWPNLISLARQWDVPVVVINGRMSERSHRGYRRIRWIMRKLLNRLNVIAVQDEIYAERFRQLGAEPGRIHVTGSMKFDGAEFDRHNERTLALRQLAGIGDEEIVFLAGSTQEPEEQFAINIFRKLAQQYRDLRLVLVPRHPERFAAVEKLLQNSGLPYQTRTGLSSGNSRGATPPRPAAAQPIILVNRMGELQAWWGTAAIAFVGGSFGEREGQNMIEPAAYGAAVAVGPRTRNFRDVMALLRESNAITVVHHAIDLEHFVRRCLEHPAAAAEQGDRAQNVVRAQQGATTRTADLLEPVLVVSSSASGQCQ